MIDALYLPTGLVSGENHLIAGGGVYRWMVRSSGGRLAFAEQFALMLDACLSIWAACSVVSLTMKCDHATSRRGISLLQRCSMTVAAVVAIDCRRIIVFVQSAHQLPTEWIPTKPLLCWLLSMLHCKPLSSCLNCHRLQH